MTHLTRHYMYNHIGNCLRRHNLLPLTGKILGISGIKNFQGFMSVKNVCVTETNYPEIDMQNLPFDENIFNFVISDQVIEHLEDPRAALNESHRVLNKGGIAIHTTCFFNYIHPYPQDFWRFTPDALRSLCKPFSQILTSEGWGNRFAILLCLISHKFRYINIPATKSSLRYLLATYNESRYPIVTWIIAKK